MSDQKKLLTNKTQNLTTSENTPRAKVSLPQALNQVHKLVLLSVPISVAIGLGLGYWYDVTHDSKPVGMLVGVILAAIVGEIFIVYQARKLKNKQKLII